MHTLKIIGTGVALLLVCLLISRFTSAPRALATAAIIFIPLWFFASGVNMYIGVRKAGYTVAEELPIFCLVFAVPVVFALGVWLGNRR
jgi:hypothetical protein